MRRAGLMAMTAFILGACNLTAGPNIQDGIAAHQNRLHQFEIAREYRRCRTDALALDSQARGALNAAQYLKSAELIEKCEQNLGSDANIIPEEERMRTYALSVQNHFKGGDVAAARRNLETFKSAFPGKDLYYADGTSFTDTMEILLGVSEPNAMGQFSVANVNGMVKSELRRVRYWKRN